MDRCVGRLGKMSHRVSRVIGLSAWFPTFTTSCMYYTYVYVRRVTLLRSSAFHRLAPHTPVHRTAPHRVYRVYLTLAARSLYRWLCVFLSFSLSLSLYQQYRCGNIHLNVSIWIGMWVSECVCVCVFCSVPDAYNKYKLVSLQEAIGILNTASKSQIAKAHVLL